MGLEYWFEITFGFTDFQARLCVLGVFFVSAILWGILKGLLRR